MANRLAREPSPYLQQHRDNPVDWWPWGKEAFEEARRRNVPVFVSIGYATCHWCHVMAHESFEDPGVARLMNDAFVNVKVDREERPDVDEAYMRVCQAMTGAGGWPLNVVLTPDREPFFAATYVPKTARFGRAGMLELVPKLREAWEERREQLVAHARHVVAGLQDTAAPPAAGPEGTVGGQPVATVLERAVEQLRQRHDPQRGGFGGPPKFPSPQVLRFLLRTKAGPAAQPGQMAIATLAAMARGGIHDHVGGGFHRYSTDADWLVPHFEKMLYDQAMLLVACAEAHLAGWKEAKPVAMGIVAYLERDLRHKDGAFFCAEDADSEGEEGLFYTWPMAELAEAAGKHGTALAQAWGATKEGNFLDEAHGTRSGRNILHRPVALADVAKHHRLAEKDLARHLEAAKPGLLARRAKRVRPLRDEKILTDWNALAIAALARASVAMAEPRLAALAAQAASFVLTALRPGGRLRHRWKDGRVDAHAFVDDHAFLLWGLVELHQATQDPRWLQAATETADAMLDNFRQEDGAFATSPRDGDWLPIRPIEAYDGALPSGNAVAVEGLWRLGRLTANASYEEAAWAVVARFGTSLAAHPSAFTGMLVALEASQAPLEVLVAGPPGDARTTALLDVAIRHADPATAVLTRVPGGALDRVCPWTTAYGTVGAAPAAYVCRDHACERPVVDAKALEAALSPRMRQA